MAATKNNSVINFQLSLYLSSHQLIQQAYPFANLRST